jgi:cobalt-zinc-cadmium efflux system outer membrane protein
MLTRTASIFLVSALLVGVAKAENEPPVPLPIDLTPDLVDGLIAEAQGRNPALAAAGARADAAISAVAAVRTWVDPVVTLGYAHFTARGMNPAMMGDLVYGVEQKLPVFNRPKLEREAATADAARENLMVSAAVAKLRHDLTLNLIGLALAGRTVELTEEDHGWLDATLTAVDHRYRVGKATQVEWLKIQTERAKTLDRIKTLKLEREHQQVELNRLLNRDLRAVWPVVMLPPMQCPVAYDDNLVNAAVSAEPKLKVLRQETAQAEAAARVIKQQRRPDIGIGLQGRSYSGDAGFREGMVTVSFSVPWLNAKRYNSDYARERARVRASEHDVADYTLTLREELHHLIIELDAARRQALLYRDELIPLTEQTLSSASAAWQNNLGLFQDVLDAHRMLVDHNLRLAQALAEQARKTAELTLRIGTKDLTAFFHAAGATDQPMPMRVVMPQTK